jgi:hypothetical protein
MTPEEALGLTVILPRRTDWQDGEDVRMVCGWDRGRGIAASERYGPAKFLLYNLGTMRRDLKGLWQ